MATFEAKSPQYTQITHDTADGKRLVVESLGGGHADIYLENEDGSCSDSITVLVEEKAVLRNMLSAAISVSA